MSSTETAGMKTAMGAAENTHSPECTLTQNGYLSANIQTRLTNIMRDYSIAAADFFCRSRQICEEIPARDGQFAKLVIQFEGLLALQFCNALLRTHQFFPLAYDEGLHLQQLALKLEDFVREFDFEGKKFLAVAFNDKALDELLHALNSRNGLGQFTQHN